MWRRVVVVVPCFNEASRLRLDLFEGFAEENPDIGFLFVDDGSTDGTGEMIQGAARSDPDHLRALSFSENRGKGEAVRQGLLEAMGSGAAVVGYWDADLATPLGEILGMLSYLDSDPQVKGVLGSRVRLLGRAIERQASRHYLGRLFATFASLVLGLPVYDTQCGAKVFASTEGLAGALEEPFTSRWIFDVEILGRLKKAWGAGTHGWLREHPVEVWSDVQGSKVRARDFLRAGLDLVSLWRGMAKGTPAGGDAE